MDVMTSQRCAGRASTAGFGKTRGAAHARPCLMVLWLLVATAAAGIAQPAAESPIFSERVEVRLIHLDVLVTDARGEPVATLGKEDFEVRADGQPVEISFFSQPKPAAPPSDANRAPDVEEDPSREEWILYFDDERLPGSYRQRVIRSLESLFESWPPGAPIRIVFRRGTGSIEEGPFDDPASALEILAAPPKALARGIAGNRAREVTLSNLQAIRTACIASGRSPCLDCWNEQLSEANSHAVSGVEEVQRTIAGLANMIAGFDPRQGQRSLVYIGDGLPQVPGASVYWSLGEVCVDRATEANNEALAHDQGRLLAQLGALANAQRVAFHLIDAGGLRHSTSRNDSDYNLGQQDGLLQLAKATGGSAVVNANNPARPMRRAVDLESKRYTLGFTLEQPPNGQVYDLSVRLVGGRQGLTLSYRRSFFDQLPEDRLLQRLTALLDPLTAGERDPDLELQAGSPEEIERGLRKIPLRISFPEERLAILPGPEGGSSGRLGLALASADAKGRFDPPRYRSITVGSGGVEPSDGRLELVVGIPVPKGPRKFVVALRDEITGEEWFATLDTDVP